MIGSTLSHYHIESEIGRGGMGIVYRATDTKLNRTVAIKVLPSAALATADDRARFYREAQAAAQLHHSSIATIFQIDEAVPSDAPCLDVGLQTDWQTYHSRSSPESKSVHAFLFRWYPT
jgi:serine/threonine protein kinase